MTVNAKICDTLYSLQARVPIKWPIWDRFGSVKMMVYLDPSCNGVMIVVTSHDEEKKKFFGNDLPSTPEGCVRINIRKQFRYFEKIDNNSVRMMILNDADIGMGILPDQMKDVIMKQKIVYDMPKFKQNFLDIQPKYKERVAAKKDFYTERAHFVAGED